MTKRIAAVVVMLVAGLPGMAAPGGRNIGAKNQFHVWPAKGTSKFADRVQSEFAARSAQRRGGLPAAQTAGPAQNSGRCDISAPIAKTAEPARAGRGMKPRANLNPPLSSIGLVSAAQIPAGGAVSTNAALEGDFNGDGKKDLMTVVINSGPCGTSAISVAVTLGNQDGTFRAPILTPVPSNSSDAFVVGDLNGDGKEDVVIIHVPGSLGTGTPASFDVLLSNGDGTFTAGNNYVITANQLAGGILYDVNGDGKLDAVVVDASTPGNVWTLLGNGDGTFGAPTAVTLSGRAGASLVFADLNGDGMLDFADNDYVTGELTVYLATSATAYAAPALSPSANGIYDAYNNAVGDMTGDVMPEIVSANVDNNTITIYVNNGDGSFQSGVTYNVATAPASGSLPALEPTAVAVADVNGDGKADVIVTDYLTGDLAVLLSNGDGTVQVPVLGYATGGYPWATAVVADFNGDGLPDLVETDGVYSYAYMKGYGDGTFRAATDFYTPTTDNGLPAAPFGSDVATGDLNGDGIPDLVIGNWCCDATVGITVFLSRGDGSLQPGVNYGSGGSLGFVTVADFNQDGKLDIAAVDNLNGAVQIFTGNGDGTFTAGTPIATGDTDSETIVAADLNGDGYPDLVVANNAGSSFGVIMNDGTGAFLAPANTTMSNPATVVAAADVNGDGIVDLVLPQPSCGCVAVFVGNGDGTFQPENQFPAGNGPAYVAVGDLNGDGKADLAITINDPAGMGISVLLGNGDGTFKLPNTPAYATSLQSLFLYNPFPEHVRMTDLDGDGQLDLIYTNRRYGTVGIMYGVGDGTFYDPVEFPTGSYADGLSLADVNGDGAVDVVTVGNSNGASQATVLINSSGSGALPNYAVVANPPSATVNAGGTGTYTFTLTPRNFYNGVVTFSCGTLPSETTCHFSSPTLTPNGNATMTTTLTLVTTAAGSAALRTPLSPHSGAVNLLASLGSLGLFGLVLAGSWKKKSQRVGMALSVIVLGLMFITVGCGGGGGGTIVTPPPPNPGTPAGTYQVVVTATGTAGNNGGNTAAHLVNVSLTVN